MFLKVTSASQQISLLPGVARGWRDAPGGQPLPCQGTQAKTWCPCSSAHVSSDCLTAPPAWGCVPRTCKNWKIYNKSYPISWSRSCEHHHTFISRKSLIYPWRCLCDCNLIKTAGRASLSPRVGGGAPLSSQIHTENTAWAPTVKSILPVAMRGIPAE